MLVPLGLCFTLMNVTYLSAIILTTPANAIWLQAAAPWWVFLFSVVVFCEPVVRRDLIPLGFGIAGVGTILACEIVAHPGQNLAGIACGVVSGITYGGVVVFMGKLNTENASWLVALNHSIAAAVMLPWVVYLGLWPSLPQLVVLAAFRALGCRDFARVDFLLDDSGRAYFIEANTIPGFTERSLLPMAAATAGTAFPVLCDKIAGIALCRAKK